MSRSDTASIASELSAVIGTQLSDDGPGWAVFNVGDASAESLIEAGVASGLRLRPSHEGSFSPVDSHGVRGDFSRTPNDFDFHSDGLYEPNLPDLVVLHCVNPGTADSRTVLSDSTDALSRLDSWGVAILRKIHGVYIGRNGDEYVRPLVYTAPNGREMIEMPSRGYLRPNDLRPDLGDHLTVRDISAFTQQLLDALEASLCASVSWNAGDLLLFDNHRFPHARRTVAGAFDPSRKLHRIWFDRP